MTRRLSTRFLTRRLVSPRGDLGAATAEYAVVTVAAAGLGGILIKILTSEWFQEILRTILMWIIKVALQFFGIGG